MYTLYFANTFASSNCFDELAKQAKKLTCHWTIEDGHGYVLASKRGV